MKWIGIISGLALLLGACMPVAEEDAEDRLLAKVHNKSLFLSELDGMFPEGTSRRDSALIVDAYVERWIRETLLLHEAERNIPKDLNIDKLVRDYRASLIRHNYEQILVEKLLDSNISKKELNAFYEKNKEQYQLETPIMRCYFIKVPLPVPEAEELRRMWNSRDTADYRRLVDYCNRYAEAHFLEDSTWLDVDNIALEMPKGTLTTDNVSAKKDFSQRDGDYQYYLRVFEVKNRKEIAPLAYIEGQARKVLLRNQKSKLLEDIKEEMYELEMRRNNIHVYTDFLKNDQE